MGVFRNRRKLPYSKVDLLNAKKLIKSANIYAITVYSPLSNEFPEVDAIIESDLLEFWDYLITIAGVGTAFMEIADSVPEREQFGLTHAIQKELDDWQKSAYYAMRDFVKYVAKLVDTEVEIPDAIGTWIWVNLEKHDKSNVKLRELASSLKLVRAVGLPILMTFHDWWK